MKTLNLLAVFTRPPVFAAAIAIVAVFAFVSSATAAEKKFDALGGVTAEALTPAAMDAVQGMGSIRVGFIDVEFPYDIIPLRSTGGRWDVVVYLERTGKKVVLTRAE